MPTVWLIRHGESESNAGLVTQDAGSSALTARGHAEAEAIARLFPTAPALIITSPYRRTALTAAPTRRRFPATPHEEWPVHEFTYLDADQRRDTTLQQREPWVAAYWEHCDPTLRAGAAAESFADLFARVQAFRARLVRLEADPVAVFSHGHFLSAVLWSILTEPPAPTIPAMRHFRAFIHGLALPNGGIVKLIVQDGAAAWISPILRLPGDQPPPG